MAGKKRPDNEVKPFSIYYREYRRKKKAGEYIPPRGAPRKPDEELSKDPHAKYNREWHRRRTDELRKLRELENEKKNEQGSNS